MAQFSNPRTNVTVTASVQARSDLPITEWAVRNALLDTARAEGVDVTDLSVTLAPGERMVTITESEYNALVAGQSAAEGGTDVG